MGGTTSLELNLICKCVPYMIQGRYTEGISKMVVCDFRRKVGEIWL